MIQYIWQAAGESRLLGDCAVATDSDAVAEVARGFGARAIMTPTRLASGTDRVAFAARDLPGDIVVNLQGDEPLLPPDAIDALISALSGAPEFGMATLVVKRHDPAELENPNVVKAALSRSQEALYFSRAPLKASVHGEFYKHIGIYAYRRDVLFDFCGWEPSELERAERLEQLRALENGVRIKAVEVRWDTVAVDVPEDIAKVERRLSELEKNFRG